MMVALALLFLAQGQVPEGPIEFGAAELRKALEERGMPNLMTSASILRIGPKREGEYRIRFLPDAIDVSAWNDDVGAMYGYLEAAERVRNAGKDAWKQPVVEGKPYLAERGWNIFLPLPWDYEKNFVDNDPAALMDPKRWFFHDEGYWRTLFRQMALSRLNWLDIHGPYDLDTTRFPNLYAYFIQSEKYPKVGVSEEIKAKNLERLRWIIRQAHAHGIKVSLMSYEARFDVPHNPNPGYKGTEQEVYDYTREVVEKMIRQVPELDKLGFRIGESGRGAEFFKCYQEAVKASGRNIPLYTRSWVTRKARVVPLARESDDFTVQIKYNGEHWGAPYIMAGGRTANWHSYWYEDYLSDSGKAGRRMWPGNEVGGEEIVAVGKRFDSSLLDRHSVNKPVTPTPALPRQGGGGSSRWPSQPYKIVWQVRANGTHRVFPFYQPQWTRTSVKSMKLGTATGYTVESTSSYFPQEPRYYLADPKASPNKWTFQRDEMYMTCWGRLGYDSETPDWKFEAIMKRKFGPKLGDALAYKWQWASQLIPMAFMGFGLGPDHRSHAPELEWGGDTGMFLEGDPFDTHVYRGVKEELAYRATGGVDGRMRGGHLESLARAIELVGPRDRPLAEQKADPRIQEHLAAFDALGALGHYYHARSEAALRLGEFEAGIARSGELAALATDKAQKAWHRLAMVGETYYRPFTDRLRMHRHDFTWSSETAKVDAEMDRVMKLVGLKELPRAPFRTPRFDRVVSMPTYDLTWTDRTVSCRVSGSTVKRAWVLAKPLPSSTFFHRIPMEKSDEGWTLEFPRENWGHAIAFEIDANGFVSRRPMLSEQPYLVVPSKQGPTPPIYSSEEAMTYLKPEILDPSKHGWLLVATRGHNFHRSFNRQTQRKLLLAVERGMNLLVMQQDYASGRYPLDWLPVPLRVANRRLDVFDPGGTLGLEKVETRDAMWQPFEPSPGWQVHGNGAMASLQHGKGTIWMMQGRLVQRMHIPAAARNLKRLLEASSPRHPRPLAPSPSGAGGGGNRLPVILVDAGSEGDLSSSVIPDFMNAHDIPFLTLGEVVAREQGMDSLTPVPGPVSDDDVLGGKGKEMANKWLREQVIKASRLQAPGTKEAFENERKRRKAELLRCLGLDPMPSRTPLNARITGTIQGKGYRIEKLVYESRPRFYVTAHLYLPDPMPPGKLPVIVHVNGHWAHKKGEDRLQLRSAFSAQQGYIALTIDSPGWSFEGNNLIERRAEGNHNDWFLVQGGTNATGYYVWDVIRGLDYLETRTDTDMSRIGITGASGGGLATLYAFAAEDRFAAALSVVYMSSMELAPDNGCLCNHVPATCQIGDRSDVMAIQAPKPVAIFGAEVDGEFPPDAMRLTGEKLSKEWALFGKKSDVLTHIFPGGHDYSQPMREAMIGFFDKYLKGKGDGSPVAQSPIETLNPEDRSILVLDLPPAYERTMRELSLEYLASAPKEVSVEEVFRVNGGKPQLSPANLKMSGAPPRITATFEAEPGLVTPTIMLTGTDLDKPVTIVVADDGKAAQIAKDKSRNDTRLYVDILGTGELGGFELRYPVYLGRSPAYIGAMQIAGAAKLVRQIGHGGEIHIEAHGPLSSLAALYASLMDTGFQSVSATESLRSWEDAFKPGVTPYAVQPRAHLMGSLESLRKMVKNATWEFAKLNPEE